MTSPASCGGIFSNFSCGAVVLTSRRWIDGGLPHAARLRLDRQVLRVLSEPRRRCARSRRPARNAPKAARHSAQGRARRTACRLRRRRSTSLRGRALGEVLQPVAELRGFLRVIIVVRFRRGRIEDRGEESSAAAAAASSYAEVSAQNTTVASPTVRWTRLRLPRSSMRLSAAP